MCCLQKSASFKNQNICRPMEIVLFCLPLIATLVSTDRLFCDRSDVTLSWLSSMSNICRTPNFRPSVDDLSGVKKPEKTDIKPVHRLKPLNYHVFLTLHDQSALIDLRPVLYRFGLQVKNTLWEGGVKSASFIWAPHFQQNPRVSQQLMHITDWLPTLYSAAGMYTHIWNYIFYCPKVRSIRLKGLRFYFQWLMHSVKNKIMRPSVLGNVTIHRHNV